MYTYGILKFVKNGPGFSLKTLFMLNRLCVCVCVCVCVWVCVCVCVFVSVCVYNVCFLN